MGKVEPYCSEKSWMKYRCGSEAEFNESLNLYVSMDSSLMWQEET